MLLGVIADDFTGASDVANTLSKGSGRNGGLRCVQYLGVPHSDAANDVEAGVVALKSRSIPVEDAVRQSLEALAWLLRQGCVQILFKYCSTFDSTKEGNIGPVAEALAGALDQKVTVVCPSFPETGRTVYMGHMFVGDRLLNESGLQNHPLNPMTDSDIRRWLGWQTTGTVGHVPLDAVRGGTPSMIEALSNCGANGDSFAVVDAITNDDLIKIGRACSNHRLLTGASGIALGLPDNFHSQGLTSQQPIKVPLSDGAEAILAGSCSNATRGQIQWHAARYPSLAVSVEEVMNGEVTANTLVEFIRANRGKAPLVYSSSAPQEVDAAQARFGREKVAQALEALFAETAARLLAAGLSRLVVAGGETSGAVVSALGLESLAIGPEIDPGVPVLVSNGKLKVSLALKSGNFGSVDFFEKALQKLAGR